MNSNPLFYKIKTCHLTGCVNYHMSIVENVETTMAILFDLHALTNGIIPKSMTISTASHVQYMDINGTIHIRPRAMAPVDPFDIVNFRLVSSSHPFNTYPSLDTSLEPMINLYLKHHQKSCLETSYTRKLERPR